MMAGTLYVIGAGPGDPELMTLKGARVLAGVGSIFVPKGREDGSSLALSIVGKVVSLKDKEVVEVFFPMRKGDRRAPAAGGGLGRDGRPRYREARRGKDVAFVTIGDPAFYSTFFYLYDRLLAARPDLAVEIVPGVTLDQRLRRAGGACPRSRERPDRRPARQPRRRSQGRSRDLRYGRAHEGRERHGRVVAALAEAGLLEKAVCVSRVGLAGRAGVEGPRRPRAGGPRLFLIGDREKMKNQDEGPARKRTTVYFIGAGPGDPELMTVKGRRCWRRPISSSTREVSSIPPSLTGLKATLYDSAPMDLDEIIGIMKEAAEKGLIVARLHTGDTAFYSAISEQIERLRGLGIAYEVIPGVSSAAAGAAVLGQELTIPEISQTVIFTRLGGRTPVPEREALAGLARHGATMVIFLSAGMIEKVVEELLAGYGRKRRASSSSRRRGRVRGS